MQLKVGKQLRNELSLQVDAQNEAIRKCIADNGLLWAHYRVMRDVDPASYLGDGSLPSRPVGYLLESLIQSPARRHHRPMEIDDSAESTNPKLTEAAGPTAEHLRSSTVGIPVSDSFHCCGPRSFPVGTVINDFYRRRANGGGSDR